MFAVFCIGDCRAYDDLERKLPLYVLATTKRFVTYEAAEEYAKTVHVSRKAIIVEL